MSSGLVLVLAQSHQVVSDAQFLTVLLTLGCSLTVEVGGE